jgi:hypothetical protein
VIIDRAVDRLQIQTLHPLVREGPNRVDGPPGATGPQRVVRKPDVPLAPHERVAGELSAQHFGKLDLRQVVTELLRAVVDDPVAKFDARLYILERIRVMVKGSALASKRPVS